MDEPLELVKPLFSEIAQPYHQDEHILVAISRTADVQVMLKMIEGKKVRRSEAEKVLAAFSAYTGTPWTFENVDVPLLGEGGTNE